MKRLLHFGYQGKKPADLLPTIEAGAVIVDCRIQPFSRFNAAWNKGGLEKLLGDGYQHARVLGNVNYKGGPIELVDPEAGLNLLGQLLEQQDVVVMCVCSNYAQCHRKVVVELAQARWPELETGPLETSPAPPKAQQALF